MKANKKRYLRLKTEKKGIQFKDPFLQSIKDGEYGISFPAFLIASCLVGVVVFFVYLLTLKTFPVALVAGICSCSIVYLASKLPLQLKKEVDNALEYKDFIFLLESSLRNTNSTIEAIEETNKDSSIKNKTIKKALNSIIVNVKLGDPLETALQKASDELDNSYLIMVFSLLRINHNLGTSVVLDTLDNIQKAMDNIIDNIALLKSKINSLIGEKTLFIVLTLASPIFMNAVIGDLLADFYQSLIGQIIIIVFIIACFICQFYIDKYATKVMKEL